ncbi:Mss4-like protein [Mycena galopus ATCC 62051]|nr:Mss4-like protein [Mycena galopus ATCC 62051]
MYIAFVVGASWSVSGALERRVLGAEGIDVILASAQVQRLVFTPLLGQASAAFAVLRHLRNRKRALRLTINKNLRFDMEYPKRVTGGCICGGVRYQLDFAPDHDWKRGGHTCQCTQCRKQSGSLLLNFHTVNLSELTWPSKATYAEYNSSAPSPFFRAFCKECGSTIGWLNREEYKNMEIAVGTVDEEYLVGGRDAEDKPVGGFGAALVNLEGEHYYLRNEVKGVTDVNHGTWFWKMGPVSSGAQGEREGAKIA